MTGRIRRLAAVAALTLLPVTGAGTAHAAGPVASMGAGLNLKAGPHHTISTTLHAGYWTLDRHNLICISYNSAAPDGSVRALSTPLPMPSPEADARARWIVNTYGGSTNGHVAAQEWFALATLAADGTSTTARNLKADLPTYIRQLTASDVTGYQTILAGSLHHGPYSMTLAATPTVPGQVGTVTATVRDAHGQPAPGVRVVFSTYGTAATNTTGVASTRFAPTVLAPKLTATATVPSSRTVYANTPSGGRQLVIGYWGTDTVTASTSYTLCPITLTVVTHCACGGKAASSSYEFTSDGLPGSYAVTVTVNGTPVTQRLTGGNAQVTITVPYVRGQQVTASWSALDTAGRALVTGDLL